MKRHLALAALALFACAVLWSQDPARSTESAATLTESSPDEILCRKTQGQQALAPCERAVAASPEDVTLRRRLAWAYQATFHVERAIAELEAVAERHPNDAKVYYDLAAIHAGQRRFARAEESLQRALALKPDHRPSYELSELLFELTGRDEELFDFHMSLALKGQPEAMFDLARDFAIARGTVRDVKRARDWYTRAANAGHVLAMEVLAIMLEDGLFGTPPEPENAAHWRVMAQEARGLR